MKKKLADLLAEFGKIAIATYLTIFALAFAGFAVAINSGVEVEGVGGGLGLMGGAWLATKLTQPLRIVATLALTPALAALLRIKRNARQPPAP